VKVPLSKPWFDADDEAAVLETLRSAWVGQGPKVAEFERRFSERVGAPMSTAVNSCTAALHVAVLAAGIGPGDEVIVPAFTWLSTANAVEYAGAKTVFCDIDPVSFNVDVADAARRVTARTKAIIPVHLFGLAADMAAVQRLAAERGLVVIEDAACALGAYVGQRHVGTIGDVGCFSFHPRKSITTGEGGMLTTANAAFDRAFRSLRDIGSDRPGLSAADAAKQLMPDYPVLGFNFRMTDLQAALGLSQLAKFDAIMERRFACARIYDQLIADTGLSDWLRAPPVPVVREQTYQAYVCRLLPPDREPATLAAWFERRNRLMEALARAGIGTRPGTHAPHLLGYYAQKYAIRAEDFPEAWLADRLTLALPLHAGLSESEQEWVCGQLAELWPRTA
jgi:dTDP-4-amino-4,6-dideoxygalactose transaminase